MMRQAQPLSDVDAHHMGIYDTSDPAVTEVLDAALTSEAPLKSSALRKITFEVLEREREMYDAQVMRSDQLLSRLRVLREKQFALTVMIMGVLLVSAVVLFVNMQLDHIGWLVNLGASGAMIIGSIVLTYVISSDNLVMFADQADDDEDPLAKSFKVTMPFIIFAVALLGCAGILALFVWLGSRTKEADEEKDAKDKGEGSKEKDT